MKSDYVELRWSCVGQLPSDYGYHLFSAVCHRLSARIHEAAHLWTMSPVIADPLDRGGPGGSLRIRCPLPMVPEFIGLHAPEGLAIRNDCLRIAPAPTIHALRPHVRLHAAKVIARGQPATRDDFGRALVEHAFYAYGVELRREPPGATLQVGQARSLRVAGHLYGGYAVELGGLDEAASLRLQERGLGSKTRMGCGFLLGAE